MLRYFQSLLNQKDIMGKKLWALALVGAAAYLFKTKKGGEIRKQMGDYAGKAVQGLKDKYGQVADQAKDRIDTQMA
jgi:hypothetical protein